MRPLKIGNRLTLQSVMTWRKSQPVPKQFPEPFPSDVAWNHLGNPPAGRLSALEEEHRRLQAARSRGGRNRARRWEPARREALALLAAGELTQIEVARQVGVNPRTIRNW